MLLKIMKLQPCSSRIACPRQRGCVRGDTDSNQVWNLKKLTLSKRPAISTNNGGSRFANLESFKAARTLKLTPAFRISFCAKVGFREGLP